MARARCIVALGVWLVGCSGGRVVSPHDGGVVADDGGTDASTGPGEDAEVDTGTPTPCTPQNCPSGCCIGDNCQPGTTAAACGAGGVTCQDCVSLNMPNCLNQVCMSGCMNCSGCCDLSGACEIGTQSTACGSQGGACTNCMSLGQSCVGGACQ